MENTTIFSGRSGEVETTATLVIKEFSEVIHGFESGMFIKSDTFMVGSDSLSIRVYPKGSSRYYGGFVSVFLHNDEDHEITVNGVPLH